MSDTRTTHQFNDNALPTDLGVTALGVTPGGVYQPMPLNAAGTALAVDATITPAENTTIVSGIKMVAAAGAAEPVVAGVTLMNVVQIQALTTNMGTVHIGDSSVDTVTNPGTTLYAGDSMTIDIDDLNKIYVDVSVNGEGISFNRLS